MGDYYEQSTGRWVGRDSQSDDRVYIAVVKSERVDDKKVRHWEFSRTAPLSIGHREFQRRAATAYGESSAFRLPVSTDLANEMMAIAYVNQRNGVAYGANNDQARAYANTTPERRTGKMRLANFAILNQVTGGTDPSFGATMWDGAEQAMFPASDTRASTGKWELHMNTMGWNISDQHYATWKANVGSGFKAPQVRVSPQDYPKKGYYNKGKTRLHSTAVYGRTIFWRVTP